MRVTQGIVKREDSEQDVLRRGRASDGSGGGEVNLLPEGYARKQMRLKRDKHEKCFLNSFPYTVSKHYKGYRLEVTINYG